MRRSSLLPVAFFLALACVLLGGAREARAGLAALGGVIVLRLVLRRELGADGLAALGAIARVLAGHLAAALAAARRRLLARLLGRHGVALRPHVGVTHGLFSGG